MRLLFAFAITMGAILFFSYITPVSGTSFGPVISIFIIGSLCLYVYINNQRHLDLVMTTEYQNLLFAQGIALGNQFSIFVRRNGTIVYANKGLSEVFGAYSTANSQALEQIFEQGGVSTPDRARIMEAIFTNAPDRIAFPVTAADGSVVNYIVTIEPIPRPAGYVLLRGREYREARAGVQVMPDMLSTTTAEKIDQLLKDTPVAHYTVDAAGRFDYVNPAFEHALGFAPGQLLEQRFGVQEVISQWGAVPMSEDYTIAEFEGQGVLRRQDGSLLNALLVQHTLRDEQNKLTGATGSVLTTAMMGV